MIAAVEFPTKICIVRWVGRRRLSAIAVTYCGDEADASEGTVQVPDRVFYAVRTLYTAEPAPSLQTPTASTTAPARLLVPCAKCAEAAR